MSDAVAGPVIFFSIILGSFILSVSLIRMLFGCWPWAKRPATTAPECRRAMHQSGPTQPGVCPVCGMDDPDHLESHWRTWPVHTDCLDWLMPGGPSFVDEYTNPALSNSSTRARILGSVTTAEAGAAIAAMFNGGRYYPVEVTTLSDSEPVYLESRKP